LFSDLDEGNSSEFESSMNGGIADSFNNEVASSNFASPEDAFGPSDDDVPF
ncbi:hypothetical protein G1K49_03755, partial [Tenacibaculum finnmarkense]|nr:hypothetical protein [Tenacibaculum finnmarkense]